MYLPSVFNLIIVKFITSSRLFAARSSDHSRKIISINIKMVFVDTDLYVLAILIIIILQGWL